MLKTHQKFFEAASRYLQVLRVGRVDFFFCGFVGVRVGVSRAFFFVAGVCLSLVTAVFFFFGRAGCALLLPTRGTCVHHTHTLLG